MRKLLLLLLLIASLFGQSQVKQGINGYSNWLLGWTNFRPKNSEYRESNIILTRTISTNTTLFAKNVYLLSGTVRVINNAILTIEPGTLIRGESKTTGALMITKGSQIIANGSENNPIVFTSDKSPSNRKAGDWGGLILLGNAPLNTFGNKGDFGFDKDVKFNSYGGINPNDSSGILKYVRVEFGGKKDPTGYSSNSISLAGVGKKTVIENIMVTDSFDDSFQIYGGNLTLDHVVSLRSGDDDFDFIQGSQCTISNGLAIRYPYISDPLRSRCLEIESYSKILLFDPTKNKTSIKLKNVTLLENAATDTGLLKEAIYLNKDANLEIENSVISGFKSFVAFDNFYFLKQNFKNVKVSNSIVDKCINLFSDTTYETSLEIDESLEIINEWFLQPSFNLVKSETGYDKLFMENDLRKQPDFRLK
jgi:hypothetical protein